MSRETGIQWCNHTFNPWEGCVRVSAGCEHCYAEARADRFHPSLPLWKPASAGGQRLMRSASYWREPEAWNADAARDRVRRRVFCASLADVLEDHPAVRQPRRALLRLIDATPWLDWLLLTKRPENLRRFLPRDDRGCIVTRRNVWLGTTAEDQAAYDRRVPMLLDVPAVVHFVSAEPLLGPLDLRGYRPAWIIVGGESGRGARRMLVPWVEDIVRQAHDRGARVFVKQMGSAWSGSASDHAGDPAEWVPSVRVREFPTPFLRYVAL